MSGIVPKADEVVPGGPVALRRFFQCESETRHPDFRARPRLMLRRGNYDTAALSFVNHKNWIGLMFKNLLHIMKR
jgi:hypothetical protein